MPIALVFIPRGGWRRYLDGLLVALLFLDSSRGMIPVSMYLATLEIISAIGLGLGLAIALVPGAAAQQNPVTAIDIALEPDATMIQHATAANARLLKSFPKGFSLDATHHPHISMLQQFVRTDDLDKVFAAANAVLSKEKPTTWALKAFKYYYIPAPPDRSCGNRRRTDRRPASAARCAHQGGRALHCED